MSNETMERLARANPVQSPPPVPRFRQPDGPAPRERRPRRHGRRNRALALAAVAGAAAITIVLASGSPRSPVDVLAEVYAATAPQAGVVETVAVIRSNPGTPHRSTEHLREWLQASAGRRRAIISRSDPHGATSVDVAYSPGTWEAWSAGAADSLLPFKLAAHDTIQRVRFAGQPARSAPTGLLGEQWAKTFHSGYLRHEFLVAGKVRRHGELLWKLVETPARVRARAREDQTSYYALVDPHSFLPVYTRLSDVARPGHPAITEVELLSLRRLPASAAGASLFDLEQAHPGARVVVQTVPAPSHG